MDRIESFKRWTAERRDLALDVVRIYLGGALVVLGIRFVRDPQLIQFWLYDEHGMVRFVVGSAVTHYVALTHIVGGTALALGLLTRVSALAQVPILFGAVFVVHLRGGILAPDQSLELAALVLFLLVVFSVFGGGRLSMDHHLAKAPTPEAEMDDVTQLVEHALEHHG